MEMILLFVLTLLAPTLSSRPHSKQYRSDYVYNAKTDAFYKLHVDLVTNWRSRQVCTAEGAKLMVPQNHEDIVQLHSMFKKFPDLGDYVWVADDGQAHESAEEQPIIDLSQTNDTFSGDSSKGSCDVVTRLGEVETLWCPSQLPFMCKVDAKDIPYDSRCDVYGTSYTYNATVRSCYKVPRVASTWDLAFAECRAEGAHLVVINSENEHQAVKILIETAEPVPGARASFFFFAGFRAARTKDGSPRVFRTIFNQTLVDAGYDEWAEGEPNNYLDTEYCGSIFKNDGKFNDLNCAHEFAFICEKEANP